MQTLELRPREEQRLRTGHLWVFANELQSLPPATPGDLVQVATAKGDIIGTGFYNPVSQIAVRLLGTTETTIGSDFFVRRLAAALALRERLLPGETAYRWVFGEADLMSGLIVDRYASTVVVQMLSAGMDRHRDDIVTAIRTVAPDVTGIVERNTAATRKKEGLDLRDGILWGTVPPSVDIVENGIMLGLDLLGGQKTGYFLDQKINRRFVADLAAGRTVLDCFCNVGGFALNAARGGAVEAVGIDSSATAVAAARRHAERNGLANCRFEQKDAFDELRDQLDQGRQWDIVVLDPPSFAKQRSAVGRARAGYAELNRTAIKLLAPGGLLVSSSCTQLVPEAMLMDILWTEAARLQKRLRLLHRGQQAPDHPILLAMPETQYLKFLVFDVVDA